MPQYAMLLYYPRERYWDTPEDAEFSAVYYALKAEAARAGVLRGGQALQPAVTATTITVAGGPGGDIICRTKDHRGGHAQRRGDVHRAGIVGQV